MSASSHPDLRVVEHQPGLRLRRFLILVGLSCGAAIVGFLLGTKYAEFQYKEAAKTRTALAEQVLSLREENRRLRQTQVALERGRTIDQQAILQAQHMIGELETKVSQLNSDLSFYRNIMAPGEVERNLQVQRLVVARGVDDRHFRYQLSLTQVGGNRNYVSGQAAVSVIGQRNGEEEVIPLRDLSEAVESLAIKFRFRYFQDIEGVLELPAGFQPEAVQVIAQAEGEKSARVERTFEWQGLVGG